MSALKELQNYTFTAKYARWDKDKQRRETWKEAVDRVRNMMLEKYADKHIDKEINWAYDMMQQKKVLGSQRSLSDDTPLPTPDGWKNVGDIIIGDKLFDSSGCLCTVKKVIKFNNIELYDVHFSDGSLIRASGDHLWITSTLDDRVYSSKNNCRKTRIVNTLKIKDSITQKSAGIHKNNHAIWNALPLQLPEQNLELHPYILGHWLGDGSKRGHEIACGHKDLEICDYYEQLGFVVNRNRANPWARSVYGLAALLRKYNLIDNKHIPDIYLRASYKQRLELLQGLMDSDGCIDNYGRCIFSNTNTNIIKGFCELLSSLGIKYTNIPKYRSGKHHTLYNISFHTSLPICKLQRKKNRIRQNITKQNYYRTITKIEKTDNGNATCFVVDSPDHSYLAGDTMIVTHNCLQYAGPPILNKNLRLFNCIATHIDRPRVFQEYFYSLLCGSGVGVSVQKQHIAKLPQFTKPRDLKTKTYVIPDTIEGWSDSLGVLLSSYFEDPVFPEYYNCNVEFNYSKIRPKGSPLSSGVGKAPGADGLRFALNKIRELLDRCIVTQDRLRPIDAYDICMHTSDSVLSGGVRRSSTLALFSFDDDDMMKAKTGNWLSENPQRARANNSVALLRDKTTYKQFKEIMQYTKQFGEPGFIWLDDLNSIVNPCLHRDTRISTDNGLIRIEDLCTSQKRNKVISDTRVLKDGKLDTDNYGVICLDATKAQITQKNVPLYELKTEHGHVLHVTDNHNFPTTNGWRELKALNIGDTLLLPSGSGSWGDNGTFEQGLILGLITGDGTLSKCHKKNDAFIDIWEDDFDQLEYIKKVVNNEIDKLPSISNGGRTYNKNKWYVCTITETVQKRRIGGRKLFRFLQEILHIDDPYNIKKDVPECVWHGSREFVIGYLQGFFFSDGCPQISGHKHSPTLSFRLSQSNEKILQSVQILLNNFAITSRIYLRKPAHHQLLPDGKGGRKSYVCKSQYELIINRTNAYKFNDIIGWLGRKKQRSEQLLNQTSHQRNISEKFITKVKSIKYFQHDDVFCLTQPKTNCITANGLVTGQCSEIGLYPIDVDTGKSGFQTCNLSTINSATIKNVDDFFERAKAAAIIGTLQAGFTNFPYLGETSEIICRREALIGVSMTGMMENFDIVLSPENQRKAARIVKKTNQDIARRIYINPAARATTLKPEGSASCMLGTSSGIHPHHAKRYIRRVQANRTENVYQYFKQYNPRSCEKSVWSANDTDDVIMFPIEVPDGSKTKNQLPALQMLEIVKSTQQNWIETGKTKELCVKPSLSHSVSNTIIVQDDEWDEVAKYIYDNKKYFTGISLISASGDKDYPQAPFVTVYTSREIVKEYGDAAIWCSGLIELALLSFDDLWTACSALLNEDYTEEHFKKNWRKDKNGKYTISSSSATYKKECDKLTWIEKANKFAHKYFEDDKRKLTYCLKDVYNWKLYSDLKDSFNEIDYTKLVENDDFTKHEEEVACAGGACLI